MLGIRDVLPEIERQLQCRSVCIIIVVAIVVSLQFFAVPENTPSSLLK
jgi:hypothetical protein